MVLTAVTLAAALLGSVWSEPLRQGAGTYNFQIADGYDTPISFGGLLNNAVVSFAFNQYNTTIVDSSIMPLSYNSSSSGSAVQITTTIQNTNY